MLLCNPSPAISPDEAADQDYARQYNIDFVSRWDELIDWKKRAVGEGHFFTDLLLGAGVCRVFDVSTGSGFHAVQLREACFDVTASDGSPTMVERARANLKQRGLKVPLYHCDWHDLGKAHAGAVRRGAVPGQFAVPHF